MRPKSVAPLAMAREAATTAAMKRWRRCASRRAKSSKPTPTRPATIRRNARSRPSASRRASAANGSFSGPPGSLGASKAGGKQAEPGTRDNGSPSTMKHRMRSPRPMARKASTSALTHRERAAAGEQTRIRASDAPRASRSVSPRSPALGSSSRSRNTGRTSRGTTPNRPWVATIRRGRR